MMSPDHPDWPVWSPDAPPMTMREFNLKIGRPTTCDPGTIHVLYVPPGRTLDDVLAEIAAMGKLAQPIPEGGDWVAYECQGGDSCGCQLAYLAPDYRWRINGVLVYGPPENWPAGSG